MKLIHIEYLISKGRFVKSSEWNSILDEITLAIKGVVWPLGNTEFIINPTSGNKRGEGNGVKPIKDNFISTLAKKGWNIQDRSNPYRLDAVKFLSNGKYFGLEWETGNISSTHRSINRILLAHKIDNLIGGLVVLPSRELYRYLTDRVGNYQEIEPYFPLWRDIPWSDGILAVVVVEYDDTDQNVMRIAKGTDGRAKR